MTTSEQIEFIERELSDIKVMYDTLHKNTRKLLQEEMFITDRAHLEWSLTKLHTATHYLEEALKQHREFLNRSGTDNNLQGN